MKETNKNEVKNENWFEDIKWKLKVKYESARDWCIRNKQMVVTAAPLVFGGILEIIRIAGRKANIDDEKELKNLYIYDRSMGHYWRLRRELTNGEYLEIEKRRSEGESMGEILESMRVLY